MAGTERQPLLEGNGRTAEENWGTARAGVQDMMANNAAAAAAADMQNKADDMVNTIMNKCGGDTWCNYIVDKRQFEEYPAMTLLVARVVRGLLAFFIVVCVIALVMSYFFEGKITTIEEIDQQEWIPAPNLALCPQPWGTQWGSPIAVQSATMMQVPGGNTDKQLNYTRSDCTELSNRLKSCTCFLFSSNILRPHGERGNLEYWDYVRLSFSAEGNPAKSMQYAYGFFADNKRMPQQWTYAQMGHTSEGDVKLEEVAKGKTEFTEGETEPRFSFRLSGEAPSPDGMTVLIFGYDKYLAYIVSSFGNKYSIFAIMTILITFCAAINNFGLFEIFFPEKVDEDEPAQLQPNLCCATLFGPCCMLCKPKDVNKKELEEKLVAEGSSVGASPPVSAAASPAPPGGVSPRAFVSPARPAPKEAKEP